MINLIKEEKDEITILTPKCGKCDLYMSGFFYQFYKNPSFTPYTEVKSSFFWTEIKFMCPKCHGSAKLSPQEIDILNSYPLDKINWPPGFDSKNMKVQRLTSR